MLTTLEKPTFLLDANVFIEAKRRYYAFDLCPGFWDCLTSLHGAGHLYSIDRIKKELEGDRAKKELERENDELVEWLSEAMPSDCFLSTDDDSVISCYRQIISWVYEQEQFKNEAKTEFGESADGWLVTCAKAREMVLVTQEVYAPDARRKVKMPNICREFGVHYTDTFGMLRELGVSFHWKRTSG